MIPVRTQENYINGSLLAKIVTHFAYKYATAVILSSYLGPVEESTIETSSPHNSGRWGIHGCVT